MLSTRNDKYKGKYGVPCVFNECFYQKVMTIESENVAIKIKHMVEAFGIFILNIILFSVELF